MGRASATADESSAEAAAAWSGLEASAEADAAAAPRHAREAYRIFEHTDEEAWAFRALSGLAACAASQALAYGSRRPRPERSGEEASEAGLLPVALLLAVATSGVATAMSLCGRGAGPAAWRCQDHALAVAILGCHLGLLAACQAAPAAGAEQAPGALEAAAVVVLVVETLVEPIGQRRPQSPKSTVKQNWRDSFEGWAVKEPGADPADAVGPAVAAAALVGLSWALRCWPEGGPAGGAPPGGQRPSSSLAPLLQCGRPAALCALCLMFAVRNVSPVGRGRGIARQSVLSLAASAQRGLQLSGIYAAVCLALLAVVRPSAKEEFGAWWALGTPHCVLWLAGAAVSGALSLLSLLGAAGCCAPSFASRAVAFTWAACSLTDGLSSYRWLVACGLLTHLWSLAAQNRDRLREAALAGRFGEVAPHVVGAQALWDNVRCVVATSIWKATVTPWSRVANFMFPPRLRTYCCPVPVPELGVPLGIAAHYTPKFVKEAEPKVPGHFVCNVGQIGASALSDIQKTFNNLMDVWQEFRDPEMGKGLITNMVAVFPFTLNNGRSVAKEINLSAWESGKDAYEWYVKSPGHRTALKMHSSGLLKTFGNLLASVEPEEPILHQDRCRRCGKILEGAPGSHAPAHCDACGGSAFGYPTF